MLRRLGIGTVLVAVGAFLALALPGPARTPAAPVPVDPAEQAQTVAALAPRRTPPVVAVLGQNDGTETTDFLVPYGVLRESGAAEVVACGRIVSTGCSVTGPGCIATATTSAAPDSRKTP